VNKTLRESTKRNHTATHLLQSALKKTLGNQNINQAGSLVTPEYLRFDFTYPSPLTPEQINAVEQYVNKAIAQVG